MLANPLGRAPEHPRQLYWRYLAAEDEHERANLATKHPERFAAMKQAWERWNTTMLPYPPDASSFGKIAADRY
jgi:hypothetical protein